MKPDPDFSIDEKSLIWVDASTPINTCVYVGDFAQAPNRVTMSSYVCMACRVNLMDEDTIFYQTDNPDTVFHLECVEAICELVDPTWMDMKFERIRGELIQKYEK